VPALIVFLAALWGAGFIAHGFALRREKNFVSFWGAICLAFPGPLAVALYLTTESDVADSVRNVTLGITGAAAGMALLIWLGYVIVDFRRVPSAGDAPSSMQSQDSPGEHATPQGPVGFLAQAGSHIDARNSKTFGMTGARAEGGSSIDMSGGEVHAQEPPPRIVAPNNSGIITYGQTGNNTIIN
jgi:hypothetical protein